MATFRPDLMLNRRLPTGGDLGATHYIPQAYGRILPWRITGWASGWFAGIPLMQFYFPLPYIAIVALSAVVPYPIAFKVVAVAGVASLPFSFYAFHRLAGSSRTTCAFALAFGLVFIYNESYTILGGNIDSTMAGEFAYAISLSLSVVVAGIALKRTATREGMTARTVLLPAALLAAAVLCHVLPPALVAVAFATLLIGRGVMRRLIWLASVSILAFGLAAAWLVPLLGRLEYTARAAWTPVRGWAMFTGGPACTTTCRWSLTTTLMVAAGAAGILIAIIRRDRKAMLPAGFAIAGLVATLAWPPGAVFNQRWLPIFYAGCALLAAYASGSVIDWAARLRRWSTFGVGSLTAVIAVAIGAAAMVTAQFAAAWTSYNFSGYESKPGWSEYQQLMSTISDLPDSRILWEYSPDYQRFGTTRALELIPYWTGHRSMEGLLIESSISAPPQFIMQSEVSERGSGAVPGIEYPGFDFETGLEHMKTFGIRYFIAWSDTAKSAAKINGLEVVATAGNFTIFEIESGGEVVVPSYEPVAAPGGKWRDQSMDWWRSRSDLDLPLAFLPPTPGPQASQMTRSEGVTDLARSPVAGAEDASVVVRRPSDGVIEFTTNRVGAPHIVKESYFPTWRVEGGEGPYLIAPSLMLVYPEKETVRLVEDGDSLDAAGVAISLAAISISLIIVVGPRVRRRRLGRL